MFAITEMANAEAAAIRAVFRERGELSPAIELRRLFPGITDNVQARGVRPDHRGLEATAAGEADAETAAVTPGTLTRVGVALRRWGYRPLAPASSTSPWQDRGAHQQTRSHPSDHAAITIGRRGLG
jgi:hypothetical protein